MPQCLKAVTKQCLKAVTEQVILAEPKACTLSTENEFDKFIVSLWNISNVPIPVPYFFGRRKIVFKYSFLLLTLFASMNVFHIILRNKIIYLNFQFILNLYIKEWMCQYFLVPLQAYIPKKSLHLIEKDASFLLYHFSGCIIILEYVLYAYITFVKILTSYNYNYIFIISLTFWRQHKYLISTDSENKRKSSLSQLEMLFSAYSISSSNRLIEFNQTL